MLQTRKNRRTDKLVMRNVRRTARKKGYDDLTDSGAKRFITRRYNMAMMGLSDDLPTDTPTANAERINKIFDKVGFPYRARPFSGGVDIVDETNEWVDDEDAAADWKIPSVPFYNVISPAWRSDPETRAWVEAILSGRDTPKSAPAEPEEIADPCRKFFTDNLLQPVSYFDGDYTEFLGYIVGVTMSDGKVSTVGLLQPHKYRAYDHFQRSYTHKPSQDNSVVLRHLPASLACPLVEKGKLFTVQDPFMRQTVALKLSQDATGMVQQYIAKQQAKRTPPNDHVDTFDLKPDDKRDFLIHHGMVLIISNDSPFNQDEPKSTPESELGYSNYLAEVYRLFAGPGATLPLKLMPMRLNTAELLRILKRLQEKV